MLMMTAMASTGFHLMAFFWLIMLEEEEGSCLGKCSPGASNAAATPERLSSSFGVTPFLCILLNYSAGDSPRLIFYSVFIPPCLSDIKRFWSLSR